jgi:Family of unknown function (DUF6506)
MALTRFGFIVKGPGYLPAQHETLLKSPLFSTTVIGVHDFDAALVAAAQLVAQGIQLIELCGGFDAAQTETLRHHIAHAVPVGVVSYAAADAQVLDTLFAKDL